MWASCTNTKPPPHYNHRQRHSTHNGAISDRHATAAAMCPHGCVCVCVCTGRLFMPVSSQSDRPPTCFGSSHSCQLGVSGRAANGISLSAPRCSHRVSFSSSVAPHTVEQGKTAGLRLLGGGPDCERIEAFNITRRFQNRRWKANSVSRGNRSRPVSEPSRWPHRSYDPFRSASLGNVWGPFISITSRARDQDSSQTQLLKFQ